MLLLTFQCKKIIRKQNVQKLISTKLINFSNYQFRVWLTTEMINIINIEMIYSLNEQFVMH